LVDDVCADSGSDINCITEAVANQLGALITGEITLRWHNLPIKGKRFQSIGIVSIKCRFPNELSTLPPVSFFVFKKLISNVIVGKKFLRDTQTLDIYQTRLKVAEPRVHESLAIRSVGYVGEQIKCWIDGTVFWPFPDTGADLNLISTGFAKRLGYGKNYGDKPINAIERYWVDFADCSSVRTEGTVDLVISFCPPSECHPSPHKLVEPLETSAPTLQTGFVEKKTSIVETFHLISDLGFDVVLGETLLASVAAYTQHDLNFVRSKAHKISSMAVCKKRARKEGKNYTVPALTPEQRFEDNFSIEYDRYTGEQNDIADKSTHGLITTMQATVMKSQSNQRHIQWLRERRDLLELYHPGYFEKVAPQEVA
jgi:hypothetical protein